jgi:hypothetical protein
LQDEQNLEQQEGAEYDEEPLEVSSTTTTSEAPKLLRPLIKPFRSNDDLLNTLKRRQQNAKSGKPGKRPCISKLNFFKRSFVFTRIQQYNK